MIKKIEVYIRPDGNAGYIVGWIAGGPPVFVARYPATATGRACADAHKQGMIDGMRVVINQAEGLIPGEAR